MKGGISLSDFCGRHSELNILDEWDYEKNAPLTPDMVKSGSHKKVWWHCKAGHSWQTEVRVRAGGADCPYCIGRILRTGFNDIATLNPVLAAQWDNEKNGSLKPSDELSGSSRYVWWRCEKGHSWRARIISRVRGSGCPVCDGKTVIPGENDLLTLHPKIASEWNYEKNSSLKPDRVTAFSNKRVWWRCSLGHEWQAVIAARVSGNSGCPYCTGRRVLAGFNDLATLCPKLVKEWDYTQNGRLTPDMVTPGSHKRVWWRCADGHVWKAAVFARAGKQKNGCPICAGRHGSLSRYAIHPGYLPDQCHSDRSEWNSL